MTAVMTTFLPVHAEQPQPRLIRQAAERLRAGALIVYPTDSYYALGCLIDNTAAIERIRLLRGLNDAHHFTLMCKDIGQIGDYGVVDNAAFRLIKSHVPGAYTFILRAGKKIGRRLHHPSRRTMAFRIPAHPAALALLRETGEAIITTTLQLANDDAPLNAGDLRARMKGRADVVVEAGDCSMMPTTVLDFTENPPRLVREGGGAVETDE